MPKYVIRYGSMRMLGLFGTQDDKTLRRGMKAIIRTDRGLEAGEVLCEASDTTLELLGNVASGPVLREMTSNDKNEIVRLRDQQKKQSQTCQDFINKLKLAMQLVNVEHIFGGERIVVYYLADGRVDFRELVRMLASEFQTRIEMRQIGVRDEAKLIADCGDCGKPVCCNNHLVEMPPVSMRMAKLQRATLDPNKISGRCGRLKCCLRFEYDMYEQIVKELPPINARVMSSDGPARVIGHEIMAKLVLVETEDRVRKLIDASDLHPSSNNDKTTIDKTQPLTTSTDTME